MTIKPRPGAQRVSPALGAGKDPRARRSGTNEVEFPLVYENGVLKLVLSGTSPLAVDPQRGLYERVADGLEVSSASPYATRVALGDGLELRAGRIVPRFSKTVQINTKKQIVAVVSTDDVSDPTDGTAAAALGRVANELAALDTRIDVLEAAPSGSAASTEVTVDFGAFETTAATVVTGQAWVTATSKLVASVFGTEDALLDQVSATVTDRVDGVGFTVIAHAPNGSSGTHLVHVVGV